MRVLATVVAVAILVLSACSGPSGGSDTGRADVGVRSPVAVGPFQQTLTAAAANCAVPNDGSADASCDFNGSAPLICAKFSQQLGLDQSTSETGYVLPAGPVSVQVRCSWAAGLDGIPIDVGYGVRDRNVTVNFGAKCESDPAPVVKHCSQAARGTVTYSDTGNAGASQVVILTLATPDVILNASSAGPPGSVDRETVLSYLAAAATAADLPNPGAWVDPFGESGESAGSGTESNPSGELPTASCPNVQTLQTALHGTTFAAYDMNDIRCDSDGWATANVNNTHEQVAVTFRQDGGTWTYINDPGAACAAGEVPADLSDIICAVGG